MPLGYTLEPELSLLGFADRHLVDERGQFFERGITFPQARNQPLADESGDERLEFQPGGINSELAVNLPLHSPQFLQSPQPKAHRGHADPDPVGDFLHRERHRRTEEDSIDLSVGTRIAKEVSQLGKNRDQALLKALPLKGEGRLILDDGFWIIDGKKRQGRDF